MNFKKKYPKNNFLISIFSIYPKKIMYHIFKTNKKLLSIVIYFYRIKHGYTNFILIISKLIYLHR